MTPTAETVQDKTYKPLARPLFIYVKHSSYKDGEAVRSYVDFYVENEAKVAEQALFIGLTRRGRPRRTSSDPSQADSHGQPDRDPT